MRTTLTATFFAVSFLCLSAVSLEAQVWPRGQARIAGTVLDRATRQPIARTRICLEVDLGSQYSRGHLCTVPDTLGRFVLDNLPEGTHVATATCSGTGLFDQRVLRRDSLSLAAHQVVRFDVRAASEGCDMSPFTVQHGEFTGYFTTGFEESRFEPCGDTLSAWVEFAPIADADSIRWPESKERSYPSYFVNWVGTLRGPWRYGHLNSSSYEFVVERYLSDPLPRRAGLCRR